MQWSPVSEDVRSTSNASSFFANKRNVSKLSSLTAGSRGLRDVDFVGGSRLNPVGILLENQIHGAEDRFKSLTSGWLKGDRKGTVDLAARDFDEEERIARIEAVRAADEATRRRQLGEASTAHLIWLRGRRLGAELRLPQDHVRKNERSASAPVLSPEEGPHRMDSGVWFRVKKSNAATQCWRADIVAEALYAAQAIGLECPNIEIKMARSAARRNPGIIPLFNKYVEAVSSNGRRELWSPTFMRQLEERWVVKDVCPISEVELQNMLPEVHFLVPTCELPRPGPPSPLTVPVPPAIAEHFLEDGQVPSLPQVPERLPYRACYVQNEPWTRILCRPSIRGPPPCKQNSGISMGYGGVNDYTTETKLSIMVPATPTEDLHGQYFKDADDVSNRSPVPSPPRRDVHAMSNYSTPTHHSAPGKSALAGSSSSKMKRGRSKVTFD